MIPDSGRVVRLCAGAGGVAAASVALTIGLPAGTVPHPPPLREIPFEYRTHQPVVPVSVNGGAAVPFVIDTGASIHVIDREIANKAGVGGGTATTMRGGGQAAVDAAFVNGVTLATAGQAWSEQRAAIASLGYPDRKHFAGLLGAPILQRYTVQFAFGSRVMRLFDPLTYEPPAGAVLVPFELQEDLPIVRATIDDGRGPVEARLMVDTGASTFLDLNRPFVDAHKLTETMPEVSSAQRPAALGGTAPFVYATARRVTLAGQVFDAARIGLSRAQSGSSSRSERDGIIGNALLERYVMTVDYRRKILVLEK
jgi:predicted aspartyl protease